MADSLVVGQDGRMGWKIRLVRLLNSACVAVDEVAYRPVVVLLTRPLPVAWTCQLAHLSMRLDDRWGTGYWSGADAPAVPGGRCRACKHRASWLVVGGPLEPSLVDHIEPADRASWSDPYLASHQVELCGWCRLESDEPIRSAIDLERELARAGTRSISWRWH
jgi:hypothetical protein